MKIGITCYPTYGGSGAVATELGIALAARGHEVHFITYAQPFRLPVFLPRVFLHEVDVGRYPLFQYPPYDLALAVRMHEVVINEGEATVIFAGQLLKTGDCLSLTQSVPSVSILIE